MIPVQLSSTALRKLGPFSLRMIEQAVWQSLFKDLSLIEETDAIRKLSYKTHLVGDHQHGVLRWRRDCHETMTILNREV